MKLTYPRISKDKSNNYFITFYLNNNRYRLYSSKKIGGNNHPNKHNWEEQIKMTHSDVPEDVIDSIGITDGLIRLSIGIVYADDIINDLKQALNKI